MAYIYQIINDINGKVYVGKTEFSIEKRFQEHCRDYKKDFNEKRPLYAAMRKYGIEHFHISLLEETDSPEEKEKEWIEILGTFKNGYNATKGGDGKSYVDYDLIYALYAEGKSITDIAKISNYNHSTINKALNLKGISHAERKRRGWDMISKPVLCLDKKTEDIVAIFPSIEEACRTLQVQSSGNIAAVCAGKRKSAYGYKWKRFESE